MLRLQVGCRDGHGSGHAESSPAKSLNLMYLTVNKRGAYFPAFRQTSLKDSSFKATPYAEYYLRIFSSGQSSFVGNSFSLKCFSPRYCSLHFSCNMLAALLRQVAITPTGPFANLTHHVMNLPSSVIAATLKLMSALTVGIVLLRATHGTADSSEDHVLTPPGKAMRVSTSDNK
jgi:hypothetical protein